MASTPSNRLKLTPSNSPFIHRLSRSPIRARTFGDGSSSSTASAAVTSSRLSLTRVVGSTCCSPTGFDTAQSSFAYIAGGAVVVVDVNGHRYTQRFFRARPSAVPVYAVSPVPHAPATPTSTPKANDSRNRVAVSSHRDSGFGLSDWADSPTSGKTWTQRERIKSATCLSLSRDGRYLAVGETGYAPRVLIFSLDDASSDIPLVSISEHNFGVAAVAWSADSRFLASLGSANDGFLYLWKIDPRTGAAKLFQQNRCTSYVRGMIWIGSSSLITFGVRHIKVWRVDDGPAASASPLKAKYASATAASAASATDSASATAPSQPPSLLHQHPHPHQLQQQQQHQKTLPGRNILLGSLLEAAFTCAVEMADGRALICSESGDICLLESDSTKQMKLIRLREIAFSISCVAIRNERVCFGSKSGQSLDVDLDELLLEARRDEPPTRSPAVAVSPATPVRAGTRPSSSRGLPGPPGNPGLSGLSPDGRTGLVAMGFLETGHVVTVDTKRSIDIFASTNHIPGTLPVAGVVHMPIPGHGEAIMGIQALSRPNVADAAFFTWSGSGSVLLWSLDGDVRSSFQVPIEQVAIENDLEPANQLSVVRASKDAKLFATADRLGVLRVFHFAKKEYILETKAHASACQSISMYEDDNKLLLASCGRDRMAQLFRRLPDGSIEHFQTLECAAKVVQVLISPQDKVLTCSFDRTLQIHDLVCKEEEPPSVSMAAMAAIPTRVITLKATPSSMTLAPDANSVFVSLLDRTICQYELATGRLLASFKCLDEGGAETAVLDSLIYGRQPAVAAAVAVAAATSASTPASAPTPVSVAVPTPASVAAPAAVPAVASTVPSFGASAPTAAGESVFLLGLSNTDKSVRLYDAQTGAFLDREWGHTESINGVALMDEEEGEGEEDHSEGDKARSGSQERSCRIRRETVGGRKVVSVGSDGTIMIWSLDLRDPAQSGASAGRDPSPAKDGGNSNTGSSSNGTVSLASSRPPLRRVLSRAELAEFQKGSPSSARDREGGTASGASVSTPNGRRSPTRSLTRKASRYNLSTGQMAPARTPLSVLLSTPTGGAIAEDSHSSRRASAGSGSGSPPMPASPKARVRRRPSLPAMGSAATAGGSGAVGGGATVASLARKKNSVSNLRGASGFGSLNMATEQTCRQLRAYRKRLASTDPIAQDILMELDRELRLTAAALGDRAVRSKAMSEELDGLLDQKLERLVSLLDEKWRLQKERPGDRGGRGDRAGRGDRSDRSVSSKSSKQQQQHAQQVKGKGKGKKPLRQHGHDRDDSAASTASGVSTVSAASAGSAGSAGSARSAGSAGSVDSGVSTVSAVSGVSGVSAAASEERVGADDQSSNRSVDTDNTSPDEDLERPHTAAKALTDAV